jgi:hypothetical protein
MCARHSTKIALAAACLVALSAAGAALARTPGQPNATSTTAPLYNRVLQLGDLEGFWSVACPVAVTSAADWSMHSSSAAQLSGNGFMNGLREPLRTSDPAVQGSSVVAQFNSSAGARRQSQLELAQARALGGTYAEFAVPSIPGSHGYSLPDGRTSHLAIGFSVGRFQYLVEIAGVERSETAALRGRLTAAALTLFRRAQ